MTIASLQPDRHTHPLDPDHPSPAATPDRSVFRGRLGISVEEFAEAVGISRTSAYLAVQRGEVPSKMIGRRRIIPISALDAWFAA